MRSLGVLRGHRGLPLLWVALLAVAAGFLVPVIWMAITALTPQDEIFERSRRLLPSHVAWGNLPRTFASFPLRSWLWNSIVVAVLGGTLNLVLDLMAGYAFAKSRFPGRDALFAVFLATIMIPAQVYIVPQFLLIAALGGVNTLWAVIVPKAAETYGVFLARQFFLAVPDSLLDAARLDGASEWRIFWRIVLPLNKPAVAVIALLLALGYWNDFGWPLVVLKDESNLTLPVGLSFLQGEHTVDWPGLMTIALVSVVPVLVLFVALQRYFVQGVARSGIK